MKQHIKQPNYFGLTSSICSVASGLQWFADRSATGLQSVCNYCRLVCMVCKYALSMIAKTTLQSLYLFPSSKLQWGTYVRRVKNRDNSKPSMSLGSFLDNNKGGRRVANSVAGDLMRKHSSDVSVGSAQSAPVAHRSVHNLTTAKMKIRTRSRSRSRNRKGNITTLPLLFSSSMSVSEENEGHDTDNWETASGSGYRLRGIDP